MDIVLPPLDFQEFLRLFNAHKVKYLVGVIFDLTCLRRYDDDPDPRTVASASSANARKQD